MVLIKLALFLLGMLLGAQLIAAFFGIIDLWYTIRTAYPRILRNILIWCILSGTLALVLGATLRPAFFWGVLVFALCHVGLFWITKLQAKLATRPSRITK